MTTSELSNQLTPGSGPQKNVYPPTFRPPPRRGGAPSSGQNQQPAKRPDWTKLLPNNRLGRLAIHCNIPAGAGRGAFSPWRRKSTVAKRPSWTKLLPTYYRPIILKSLCTLPLGSAQRRVANSSVTHLFEQACMNSSLSIIYLSSRPT